MKKYLVIFNIHVYRIGDRSDCADGTIEKTVKCEPDDLQREIAEWKLYFKKNERVNNPLMDADVSVTQVLPLD